MADRTEIADCLESLATHCRAPLMDVDARSRWMRDWCDDLKGFPIEAIQAGCRVWRQGDSVKFPTPGQLIPVIRAQIRKAASPDDERPRAWTMPTPTELESMTLSEKVRQYRIMAEDARGKAGPMDRITGEHPRPEWIQVARDYQAEANRLGVLLREAKAAGQDGSRPLKAIGGGK